MSAAPGGEGLNVESLARDQVAAFTATRKQCEEKAGPQPNAAPLSDSQVRELYAHLVDSGECLEGLGYSVSRPPSETVFVDTYKSGAVPWSPFADLPTMDQPEFDAVLEQCPQAPW